MDNNDKTHDNLTAQEKENLVKEIESIKKRQKFLKFLAIMLSIIIFSSILIVYLLYKKFLPLLNFTDNISESYMDIQSRNFFQDNTLPPLNPSSVRQDLNISSTESTLGRINFGKEIMSNLADEETRKEVSESIDKYKDDPNMKKLIEEIKSDPELKEILSNPSNPFQIFSKMKDPKIMNKFFNKIMKDPNALSAIMKMAQEPAFQKIIQKTANSKVLKSTVSYNINNDMEDKPTLDEKK